MAAEVENEAGSGKGPADTAQPSSGTPAVDPRGTTQTLAAPPAEADTVTRELATFVKPAGASEPAPEAPAAQPAVTRVWTASAASTGKEERPVDQTAELPIDPSIQQQADAPEAPGATSASPSAAATLIRPRPVLPEPSAESVAPPPASAAPPVSAAPAPPPAAAPPELPRASPAAWPPGTPPALPLPGREAASQAAGPGRAGPYTRPPVVPVRPPAAPIRAAARPAGPASVPPAAQRPGGPIGSGRAGGPATTPPGPPTKGGAARPQGPAAPRPPAANPRSATLARPASRSIGERLRAGRERKGLTVLQAAERLHLDPHVVEHLEAENFGPLGAPVYVRGHIRRYAELIGEHPTELQNFYRAITPVVEPDLRRAPKSGPSDDNARFVVPALYALAAAVVGVALWWLASLSGSATPTTVDANPRRHPPAVAARHGRSGSARPDVASASSAPEDGPGAGAPVSLPVAATPSSAAAAPAVPAGAPLREAEAGAQAGASSSADSSSSSSSSSAVVQDTQLTLRFNSDSWTEVYDASGRQVFADVGSQGSVRTFKIKPPVKINLGNGPGVGVEVNGHRAAIDSTVRGDGSAQFTVLKDGRVVKK